ncbi:MAG: hypothetical protein IJB76_00010 [Clostridia bacterium]|nr:hypothetical protein [Clostridia bacterium]
MRLAVKRRLFVLAAVLFVSSVFVFRGFFIETRAGNTAMIVFFILYFVATLIWLRCPNCKKYLWHLTPFAKHCPHCGEALND